MTCDAQDPNKDGTTTNAADSFKAELADFWKSVEDGTVFDVPPETKRSIEAAVRWLNERGPASWLTDPPEVDLVARGLGWDDCEVLIKEACDQAGVHVSDDPDVNGTAINVLQRLANAAHKVGFKLGMERMAAAMKSGGTTEAVPEDHTQRRLLKEKIDLLKGQVAHIKGEFVL